MLTKLEKEYAIQIIKKQDKLIKSKQLEFHFLEKKKNKLFFLAGKNNFEVKKENNLWIIFSDEKIKKNTSFKKLFKSIIESV